MTYTYNNTNVKQKEMMVECYMSTTYNPTPSHELAWKQTVSAGNWKQTNRGVDGAVTT
jgi:hypothetical protein